MKYEYFLEFEKGQILTHICFYLGWNIFNLNPDQKKCLKKWYRFKKNRLAKMAFAAYCGKEETEHSEEIFKFYLSEA